MENYESLCKKVIDISKEVGEFIRNEGKNFDTKNIEYKGKNDLVSYVDRTAEEKLMKAFREILPEAAFIAEETASEKKLSEKKFHWVIDPLDGTTNFLHGLPVFSISIALMENEKVVLGVVYEINREECFYAWKGGGAFCDEVPMQVSQHDSLSESLLATGFPYRDFGKTPNYLEILKDFMQNTHGLRRMGSAAVDLAYVAAGRFEGFFEFNLSPWDVAAGSFLVQEAGGKVTTFSGAEDFIFGKEIIASGKIHSYMQAIIQKYW